VYWNVVLARPLFQLSAASGQPNNGGAFVKIRMKAVVSATAGGLMLLAIPLQPASAEHSARST
jgi:hypothetical protein